MNTLTTTSIISKFITKEVEHIYKKYYSIPEEELIMVKQFIEKLEENPINFDPYLSYTRGSANVFHRQAKINI